MNRLFYLRSLQVRTSVAVFTVVAAFFVLAAALPAAAQDAHTTLPNNWTIEQVTFGPQHHFYGYDGQVGNTPFNKNGTHLVLLETDFQNRLAVGADVARIVLVDIATKQKTFLANTRGWNFQQGTMLYWNPAKPNEEIFFNDRDSSTNKIKTVLFNVITKTKVRDFYYPSSPFGNSGVAQAGGRFLGSNYGRLDRLRPITGYAGAYDWTVGVKHPSNDGIWLVDMASAGTPKLLISFKQLRDAFVSAVPAIDSGHLYINGTLWNRDGTRIITMVRWWNDPVDFIGMNTIAFSFKPDGTNIVRFTPDTGHPDWLFGTQLLRGDGHIYDVLTNSKLSTVDSSFFLRDGELGTSRGGNWIASSEFSNNAAANTSQGRVILYSRAARAGIKFPWYPRGPYYWHGANSEKSVETMNRIDIAPCFNADASKLYFMALAPDGTRQAFVIFRDSGER